jgi:hypothetical protein
VADVESSSDSCSGCSGSLEIAAVRFSLVHHTSMILVCPGCGLTYGDPPRRISVREWVRGLRRKRIIDVNSDPKRVGPAGSQSPRGTSAAPLKES